MKNQKYNKLILVFVLGVCLLLCQPAYSTKRTSCWSSFSNNVRWYFKTRLQILKEDFTLPRYVSGSVLEPNDITSIRQALSYPNGDAAAIVNINTFTLEIAEKMRQAIQDASSKNERLPKYTLPEKPLYFHFRDRGRNFVPELQLKAIDGSFEKDWGDFKAWLQDKTQIISLEEIEQFQREVDEYVDQIKQMILEVDGQNVEFYNLIIRTEKGRYVSGHKHGPRLIKFPTNDLIPFYITASIAPIGLSTFYTRSRPYNSKDYILSYSGHTVLLSEEGRIEKMGHTFFPKHGTPITSKKRFFLLFGFKIQDNQY